MQTMKAIFFVIFLIPALSIACEEGTSISSQSGVPYTCDRSVSSFGISWHDLRGLVWSDRLSENTLNYDQASLYCQNFGGRIPSLNEWKTLATEFNYQSQSQEVSPILPNLEGHAFWTSDSAFSITFNGELKNIVIEATSPSSLLALRCVKSRATHYEKFPETTPEPYTDEILDFYLEESLYGEFSNFALFPLYLDGTWWPTSEHYFQAQKYETAELKAWVQFAPTPMEAANRGRDRNIPKRADWEQVKEGFMEKALIDKFSRYPTLHKLLQSTGTTRIIEHTVNDCYWADCGDRTGKNRLGILLEKVRAIHRQ